MHYNSPPENFNCNTIITYINKQHSKQAMKLKDSTSQRIHIDPHNQLGTEDPLHHPQLSCIPSRAPSASPWQTGVGTGQEL